MTLGTNRVRASFNPAGKTAIDELKLHAAELIDLCEEMREKQIFHSNEAERERCLSLAQTYFEIGAMFAVKAATMVDAGARPDYPADHPAPGDLGSAPT